MEVIRTYSVGNSIAMIIPACYVRELGIRPKTQLAVIKTVEGTLEIAPVDAALATVKFRRKEK